MAHMTPSAKQHAPTPTHCRSETIDLLPKDDLMFCLAVEWLLLWSCDIAKKKILLYKVFLEEFLEEWRTTEQKENNIEYLFSV